MFYIFSSSAFFFSLSFGGVVWEMGWLEKHQLSRVSYKILFLPNSSSSSLLSLDRWQDLYVKWHTSSLHKNGMEQWSPRLRPTGCMSNFKKKMGVIGRVAIYLVFNKQEVETNSWKSIVFISVLFYSYFLAPACLLFTFIVFKASQKPQSKNSELLGFMKLIYNVYQTNYKFLWPKYGKVFKLLDHVNDRPHRSKCSCILEWLNSKMGKLDNCLQKSPYYVLIQKKRYSYYVYVSYLLPYLMMICWF